MSSVLIAAQDGLHRDGVLVALEGRDVTALARASHGWMAVTNRSEVHDVDPGFATTSLGMATEEIDSVASFEGRPVIGAGDARLKIVHEEMHRDVPFDTAPGRSTWYTPWGGPPAVRSLDQGPDGLRWVNVHVGGVLVDDGSGWRPTMDIDNDVHQVIADPVSPASAWAAAAIGLGWTTDGGASWSWTDEGMHASYARAVAVTGETVFVSGSDGPGGRNARLYRGVAGGPLEPCAGPYKENIDTGWVTASEDTVAFLTPNGKVMVSSDLGTTWDEAFRVQGPRAVLVA